MKVGLSIIFTSLFLFTPILICSQINIQKHDTLTLVYSQSKISFYDTIKQYIVLKFINKKPIVISEISKDWRDSLALVFDGRNSIQNFCDTTNTITFKLLHDLWNNRLADYKHSLRKSTLYDTVYRRFNYFEWYSDSLSAKFHLLPFNHQIQQFIPNRIDYYIHPKKTCTLPSYNLLLFKINNRIMSISYINQYPNKKQRKKFYKLWNKLAKKI